MRSYGAPKSKMRTLRAADVVAHWQMEEGSGSTLADQSGASPLTSAAAGANIVNGPFYGATNNLGRIFASGSQATGSSTLAQRTELLGAWTIEAWIRPTSLSGINAIIGHGSSSAGEANNYLASLRLDGAGFGTLWQRTASKTAVTVLSASSPVLLDELQHLAARCRVTGGGATRAIDLFHNGLPIETITGLLPPTGGSTGSWEMGALPVSHGSPFDGDIYEVRVAAAALADEAIRESYSRGIRDWDIDRAIAGGEATVHTRAWVRDSAGVWVDLSRLYSVNWLDGAMDRENVDDDGATGTLEFRRRSEWLSLGPFATLARANVSDPNGRLLDGRRRFKIEEAIVPAGVSRAEAGQVHWLLAFDGYATGVADGERVTVELNDLIHPLQVAWCQPDRTPNPDVDFVYGATPTPIEAVLAQMLVDHAPTSIGGTVEGYANGDPVELFVPSTPAFTIDNAPAGFAVPSTKSVAQALLDVVDTTIAWFLRYRWDDTRQEFRFTLFDPGRSRTWQPGDLELEPRQVRKWRTLKIDTADIRNDIEIEWGGPSSTDNLGVARRTMWRGQDSISVARWWRSYCRLPLSMTSQLKTLAEVSNLGGMMLSDLSSPLADVEIEVAARRDVELGDIVRILPDGVRIDASMTLAVVGIAHKRAGGSRSTTLTLRGAAPVGRRRRWFDRVTQRGITKGQGLTPPPTPSGITVGRWLGGVVINWDVPVGFGARRYRETEVHCGATAGFTPSAVTRRGLVRGQTSTTLELTPGTPVYIKLIHRDDMNNTSAASSAVSAVPRSLPESASVRAYRSTSQVLSTGAAYQTIIWNTEVVDALGRHNTATGEYTALSAGLLDVEAVALIDTLLKPGSAVRLAIFVNGVQRFLGDVVVSPGGTPDRVSAEVRRRILVAAGDAVTVRVSSGGNAGHFVVSGLANSYAWFTPITED